MKLTVDPRAVTTDGTLESKAFTIKATSKAFKILIDKLYSDKIKAVCRELMTNAYDAHLANGNADRPFDVLLPNTYDSFFAVRDYGCSMTHERVMGLYSTVFESTKDQDNTAVGQLGLGSKSPFAYSDTFTVTCWLDGEKRVYTAYLGEDEIPRIDLMLAEPSDEPQGVEVRVPTSRHDESTFLTRVKELAYGFDVLPNIKGRQGFTLEAKEIAFQGEGWRMFKKQGYSSEKMGIRQGCVIYPFNEYAVSGLSGEASGLADLPIVIDFPIGEIDFTPSREEISYNKETQANLVRRINAFAESFIEKYTEALKAFTNEVEARRFAYGVCRTVSQYSYKLRSRLADIKWRARRVGSEKADTLLNTRDAGKIHFVKYGAQWFVTNRRNRDIYKTVNRAEIIPGRAAILWYSPAQNLKRIEERVRKFYNAPEARGMEAVILVSCADKHSVPFRRFLVNAGRPETVYELANYVPDKKVSNASPRAKIMLKRFDEYTVKPSYVEKDLSEGGWYVTETKKQLPHDMGYHALKLVINAARAAGLLRADDKVWLMPSSIEKPTCNKGPWKDLMAHLTASVTEDKPLVINAAEQAALASILTSAPAKELKLYRHAMKRYSGVFIEQVEHTGLGAMFLAFAEAEHLGNNALYSHIQEIRTALSMAAVPLPNVDADKAKLSAFKGALEAYPMLKALVDADSLNHVSEEDALAYVTLVDSMSSPVTLSAAA